MLALAAAVALGRAPVLGRWLRDRRDPLEAVCGALAAAWGGVLFADNWKFEGIAARLGLAPGMLVAVLAVAAVLAALPAAVALATWLLQRGAAALEARCRAVLESRPLFADPLGRAGRRCWPCRHTLWWPTPTSGRMRCSPSS